MSERQHRVMILQLLLAFWLALTAVDSAAARQFTRPVPGIPTTAEPPLASGTPSGPGTPGIPESVPAATGPAVTGPIADPPAPHVTIRVRVPAMATPGQDLEYRLVVDNTSPAPAHKVRVRALPTNTQFKRATPEPTEKKPELIWQLETLAPNSRKEIVLVVQPNGDGEVLCCARVQFEHGQCVRTRLTQPQLQVRMSGPTQVTVNDTDTFRIEVSNTGQREATAVQLSNTLPPGIDFLNSKPSTTGNNNLLVWNLGNIPPGKTVKVEYDALISKTGTLVNKAEVKDSRNLKQETSAQVVVTEPKLALTVAGPLKRIVGRPATYLITVSNPGTGPVKNVEVVEAVSAPTESDPSIVILSASAGGKIQGGTVRWSLGTLPPGSKQVVQLTVQARTAGKFISGADATADRGLKAHAEAAATLFEASTSLALEIDKSHDPLEVDRTGTYSVRVANQGSTPLTQVKVVFTLPEELKVTGMKGKTEGKQEGQVIAFALLEALAPGDQAVWAVTAQALRAGEVRLRATVDADQLQMKPLTCEESTLLYSDGTALPAKPPQ